MGITFGSNESAKSSIDYEKIKRLEIELSKALDDATYYKITQDELRKRTRALLEKYNPSHEEITFLETALTKQREQIEKILAKRK